MSTIILCLILFLGLSLILYPTISDYWNSLHQSRAISSYLESVAVMEDEGYDDMWKEAAEYNVYLAQKEIPWEISEEENLWYNRTLSISETGIMGYIEIPSIGCSLPIYHGTSDGVLQTSIGHIEGSSLPVGGSETHCVLSGHRGLPSAKLFSDLDKLIAGDLFMLQILDETLTYEVDQILIVLPHEVESLEIQEGKDLCTLVTCTPYGINSHRLLVRGHRVENLEEAKIVRVASEAILIDPVLVAPFTALPMLLLLFIVLLITTRKRK